MSTFVFVSGGWHGGWCWKRVADRLRSQGHEVYTPTLTGLGDRVHLYRDDIDLETHITDIMNLIEWEELDSVVLVGHSYGGMVITAVADRAPKRLERVVYLDALWPEDGETCADVIGQQAADVVIALREDPERPPLLLNAKEAAEICGIVDPDDVAWVASKLTPQPLGTQTQPLHLGKASSGVPVLFIACVGQQLGGPDISYERAKARAAREPSVQLAELAAPHDAMVTHPDEVTELLTSPY
jgi:pimeloyl-ACP methyl ester carboxylesterase